MTTPSIFARPVWILKACLCFLSLILFRSMQVVLVMNPDMEADDALVVAVELDPLLPPSQ